MNWLQVCMQTVIRRARHHEALTQRALRRTFNNLARAAQVDELVTRSISGHLTEATQHHYSTVNGAEQRAALAKVIRLVDRIPPPRRHLPQMVRRHRPEVVRKYEVPFANFPGSL